MIWEPAPARQVVLVDLDGTLLDSEPGILGALKQAMTDFGIDVPADDILRTAIGPPFAIGLPAVGVPNELIDATIAAYRAIYEDTGLYDARLYDGIDATLDVLDELGCTLCVATSKPDRSALRIIEHLGLTARFKVIGCASDDYGRFEKADVIADVLDQLGIVGGPELVMLGDRRYDIEGAAAHGIDTIGAAWGYGTIDELQIAGAWAIADTPADVAPLIAGRAI